MRTHGHRKDNNRHIGAYLRVEAGRRERIKQNTNNYWVLGLLPVKK